MTYVVRHARDRRRYVVAIRGTNPISASAASNAAASLIGRAVTALTRAGEAVRSRGPDLAHRYPV